MFDLATCNVVRNLRLRTREQGLVVSVWLIGTAVSFLSALVVSVLSGASIPSLLTNWDGSYYKGLIQEGYLTQLPMSSDGKIAQNRNAFFPVFPFLVRTFDAVLPGGYFIAFLVLNLSASLIALLVLYKLAQEYLSTPCARFAACLLALFPSSFIFTWLYAETITVLVITCGYYYLSKNRPYVSSLFFCIASAARPNGIFFACAPALHVLSTYFFDVRAKKIIYSTNQLFKHLTTAVFTSIVSSIGFFAFMIYSDSHTGVSRSWFRIQREGWGESTKPFHEMKNYLKLFFTGHITVRVITVIISIAIYLGLLFILAIFLRKKLGPLAISSVPSCAIVFILALSNGSAVASLRFAIIATPITIAAAHVIPEKFHTHVLVTSSIALFSLCFLSSWGFHPPFLMGSP